jgi:glycolate oxidase
MLPAVLDRIMAIGQRHNLTITNVFHAGDGNVHPILLFDEDDPQQVRNTMLASHEILDACVDAGGTITGEHGVGVEKLPLMRRMFNEATLTLFEAIKSAFDPAGLANTGKLVPSERVQVDLTCPRTPRTPGGALA